MRNTLSAYGVALFVLLSTSTIASAQIAVSDNEKLSFSHDANPTKPKPPTPELSSGSAPFVPSSGMGLNTGGSGVVINETTQNENDTSSLDSLSGPDLNTFSSYCAQQPNDGKPKYVRLPLKKGGEVVLQCGGGIEKINYGDKKMQTPVYAKPKPGKPVNTYPPTRPACKLEGNSTPQDRMDNMPWKDIAEHCKSSQNKQSCGAALCKHGCREFCDIAKPAQCNLTGNYIRPQEGRGNQVSGRGIEISWKKIVGLCDNTKKNPKFWACKALCKNGCNDYCDGMRMPPTNTTTVSGKCVKTGEGELICDSANFPPAGYNCAAPDADGITVCDNSIDRSLPRIGCITHKSVLICLTESLVNAGPSGTTPGAMENVTGRSASKSASRSASGSGGAQGDRASWTDRFRKFGNNLITKANEVIDNQLNNGMMGGLGNIVPNIPNFGGRTDISQGPVEPMPPIMPNNINTAFPRPLEPYLPASPSDPFVGPPAPAPATPAPATPAWGEPNSTPANPAWNEPNSTPATPAPTTPAPTTPAPATPAPAPTPTGSSSDEYWRNRYNDMNPVGEQIIRNRDAWGENGGGGFSDFIYNPSQAY